MFTQGYCFLELGEVNFFDDIKGMLIPDFNGTSHISFEVYMSMCEQEEGFRAELEGVECADGDGTQVY